MERVTYTAIPKELHRATMYQWGSRGIRSRFGFRFAGANGRKRCYFDPAWMQDLEAIPARQGHTKLLRSISRITSEWIAVAKRKGAFWPIDHYLVPRAVARMVREQREQHADIDNPVPF